MVKIGCDIDGNLDDSKFSEPIPWVGIYVAAASMACLLGMVTDAINGIRHRRFWFPCKFFSLNATTLTLIAVSVKLSVDLNTPMPRRQDQLAKLSSSVLMCTIIGNSLPSLATMENKEILMTLMAVGIIVLTVIVNICIQFGTGVIYVFWIEHVSVMFLMLVLLALMSSSALTIPMTKKILQLLYNKEYKLALKEGSYEIGETVVNKLREDLMKYWMMAHTSSPQFVMGRSATCTASGAFCLLSAMILAEAILRSYFMPWTFKFCSGESDYKWANILIFVVQTIAVGVGTIAPAFRWFIAINFRCPKNQKESCKKLFKVEVYWIKTLLRMKECPLSIQIRDKRYRKLAHGAEVFCLNFCIQMQKGIVLMSKAVTLISIFFVSRILRCCNYCKEVMSKFNNNVSSINSGEESQPSSKLDLRRFVLHLEGEDDLVELMMKKNCDATNHWIQVGEKQQPKRLLMLLEKSTISQGFKGVGEFDSDQVPPLDAEKPPNCWALPVVTMASIAVALPNINSCLTEELICTLNEALPYVKFIENDLDREGNLINIRMAADVVWLGVDLYRKWLDVDLHQLSLQEKNPKETLQTLADAAKRTYQEFKLKHIYVCLKEIPSKWPAKVLLANSMYRISQNILLNYECRHGHTSERLFEELRIMISDILSACLTNLPRVISMKCLNSAIEDSEDSVRHAVYILGKSKKIIKMLEKRSPNLGPNQMGNIDEWCSMHKQKSPLYFIPCSPKSETEAAASKSSDLYLTIE
ncbi:putative Plant/MNJ7-17 protein [Quillaja saponaria]|uniref:Plant/MNJ7-17 protein n=1 Tax=Quillaja saponaria TaxID=32244 RepID=A0AAD7KSC1_QUISA|nr:putative Plant/MNJ7-17 protein [Quillaja saponaria]